MMAGTVHLRPAQATGPAVDVLPPEVRMLQGMSSVVLALAAVVLVGAAVAWLVRLPVFALRVIKVDGDVQRSSVATLRANAMPRLAGNFFTVDLSRARSAFESVPWVRHAVVRRVWPHELRVSLEEHRAAAIWTAEDGNDRLVNTHGEVFEVNPAEVEEEGLPAFTGPAGMAPTMLALHRRLTPVLSPLGSRIGAVLLSGRGSWRVELDSGAVIELGRGTETELVERTQRFVSSLPAVKERFPRPLLAADLRHDEGYALRLRGISTTPNPGAKAASAPGAPAAARR